jgi:hypothetical protein
MLRDAPLRRRVALLIEPGSRLSEAAYRTMLRIAGSTLHRVRDAKQLLIA